MSSSSFSFTGTVTGTSVLLLLNWANTDAASCITFSDAVSCRFRPDIILRGVCDNSSDFSENWDTFSYSSSSASSPLSSCSGDEMS
jgi:hypothetical protein